MKQQGFTLIELIVVIAILSILAAVAVPKYIDLQQQARQATLDGIVGAVSAGSSVNYAARKAGQTTATIATSGANCTAVVPGVLSGTALPSGYTVASKTLSTTIDGLDTCTITAPGTPTLTGTVQILIVA